MNIKKKYAKEIKESLEPKTTFDELNVSIPQIKAKKRFSFKKFIPYCCGLVACATACAILIPILSVPNSNPDINTDIDPINIENKDETNVKPDPEPIEYTDKKLNQRFNMPQNSFETLSNGTSKRMYKKMIEKISPIIKANKTDCVYSPASFALAVTGLSSISSSFANEEFGIDDPIVDLQNMLRAWNFEIMKMDKSGQESFFKCAVMHQQVGDYYVFDDEKRDLLNENYISTLVSDNESWKVDAQTFFKNNLDINLKVPDLIIDEKKGGVLSYGVLKMQDHAELTEAENIFNYEKLGAKTVNTYQFETKESKRKKTYEYYEGETYEAFEIQINCTDMVIVLPKEGVDINSIDVAAAYSDFVDKRKMVTAYGYVPFFHNTTIGASLEAFKNSSEYQGTLCDKLLKDDVQNDLEIKDVIQSSDFDFCKYGVSAESISVVSSGATGLTPSGEKKCLNVDRPFYAISTFFEFPMFVNKVINPGI